MWKDEVSARLSATSALRGDVNSFSPVESFNPFSFSINLPPPGERGLDGLIGDTKLPPGLPLSPMPAPPTDEILKLIGRAATPKFNSIHSFSCTAICNPTPSALAEDSAAISRCRLCRRFLAQIVCKTPFLPAARAEIPSSGGKIAGRGFVFQTTGWMVEEEAVEEDVEDDDELETDEDEDDFELFPEAADVAPAVAVDAGCFVRVTMDGTATPGGNKKYSLLTPLLPSRSPPLPPFPFFFSFSLPAGNTVDLPSQLTCHSPGRCLVVSSSSHSTMSIFVPSLLLPGSNSKRARALLLDVLGDSTSSFCMGILSFGDVVFEDDASKMGLFGEELLMFRVLTVVFIVRDDIVVVDDGDWIKAVAIQGSSL